MPIPLQLPIFQNWSCHSCGGCCKQHAIEITAEEKTRIEGQNWKAADGVPENRPLFVKVGPFPWSRRWQLGHAVDGGCVFLDPQGKCRIHARFGEPAKPLACRIYPYAFHPAGKAITVSLRFSCPSVVGNRGREVIAQKRDIQALQKLVVPEGAEKIPPPDVSPGQRLDWNDTIKIVDMLDQLVVPEELPVTMKLRRALRLVDLIGQSRFDKIRGPRLNEFLELVTEAATVEVDAIADLPEPSGTARMQFRLLAAQYARKDTFAEQQAGLANRWRLFRAALRFARGTGAVPPLQEQFKEVPFDALEPSYGGIPAEAEEILTRYLRVKLQGLHFCGAAYYGVPVVEGFQSLALVIPVVLWIARWLAAGDDRSTLTTEDIARALAIADHHHGYSPAFGQGGFRGRVRLLARLDEIARLVAWYSR